MITAVLLAALTLVLTGSRAVADASPIGLSRDGVTWHDDLRAPLFPPAFRWVPGDVQDETFYVRNERPDQGDLQVVVGRTDRDRLLDTGFMHLSARAGDGPWMSVASGGRHVLVDAAALAGGRAVEVTVRAAMGGAAPNGTMVLASDLDLDVALSESVTDTTETGGQHGSGHLPDTGSPLRPWTLPLALLLLAAGAVLVVRRRTEPEEPLHE